MERSINRTRATSQRKTVRGTAAGDKETNRARTRGAEKTVTRADGANRSGAGTGFLNGHSHGVVALVDVDNGARNASREGTAQKCSGTSNFFSGKRFAQRRVLRAVLDHL